jgi:hypothetical protein
MKKVVVEIDMNNNAFSMSSGASKKSLSLGTNVMSSPGNYKEGKGRGDIKI